jgi:3-oxoacyl-[acyl-carrier protein] reductase
MNLKSKTAVVTGANSGIGLAISRALAREGANVVLGARRQEANQNVAREISNQFGVKTLPVPTDVTHESDCDKLIDQATTAFGGVDVLVNNAGVGGGTRMDATTTGDFDRVLKTNLYGTFWCSRAGFRAMRKNRRDGEPRGAIINISSLAGKHAWSGTGTYSASKFGVIAITQALAEEGKEVDIKACAICPAMVATPMTSVSGPEYIQPEDIAETVLYLLRLSTAAWPTEVVVNRKGASE